MEPLRVLGITQARVNSTRLPKKVLLPLSGSTILGTHLHRLKQAKTLDRLVVATTQEDGSDEIIALAQKYGVDSEKGSTENVLDRFYQIAKQYNPQYIVRITSDCPLIDPDLIDEVVLAAIDKDYDYYANIITEDFPDGQDIEVFTFAALESAWHEAETKSDKEHVTPFIRNNCDIKGGRLFKGGDHKAPRNYNQVRMTIDEPIDLDMMSWLIEEKGIDASWQEYVNFMLEHPEKLVNADVMRNEGYFKSLDNN